MAEAHNAVAFQFAVSDEGVVVNLDKEILKLMANSAYKSVKRRCNDAKNTFLKGVYPASPATWMFFLAALLSARYTEHEKTMDLLQRMEREFPGKHRFDRSTVLAICIFTIVTLVWLFSAYFCQFLLRKLLKNWDIMYNIRGKLSLKNKLWLAAVKLLSGFNPGLFSFQNCIPSLPVPSLEKTLVRHLDTVRPFMSDAEYDNIVALTEEFKNGVAPKLQRYLILKSLWSPNYVSDWWERFVYLRSRAPLMINSNYYGIGTLSKPVSNVQTARAANLIYSLFRYRKVIDKHNIAPLRLAMVYPLCSSQYLRQFNTTRVPGKEEDVFVTNHDSTYVVVYHKGIFYKVSVMFSGNLLKPIDIQTKLDFIVSRDAKDIADAAEKYLPILTSGERPVWADARSSYLANGVNKESLDLIEKSAFFVVLEEDSDFYSYETSGQEELNRFSKRMLHGKGFDRWFDKSFNLVICKNGQVGFNAEHSWADAPIMAQLWEWIFIDDTEIGYEKDGNCKGKPKFKWSLPTQLKWDIPEECDKLMKECLVKAEERIDDVDQYTMIHEKFGKGDIKKMKLSPDAFIQVAFQLAYLKETSKVCLTYESAMTRLFRDGRTETVRSCSIDSTKFVKAAVDPNVPLSEKRQLLRQACDHHINLCRKAMTGAGIDRHLFSLYVVSKYLQIDVPFLNAVLGEKWVLSTSQTAVNQTMRLQLEKYPERMCAGGGFGPVAENGYGISYIIGGENLISFHVSCKKSCPATNAEKFARLIEESMAEMRSYLLDDQGKLRSA